MPILPTHKIPCESVNYYDDTVVVVSSAVFRSENLLLAQLMHTTLSQWSANTMSIICSAYIAFVRFSYKKKLFLDMFARWRTIYWSHYSLKRRSLIISMQREQKFTCSHQITVIFGSAIPVAFNNLWLSFNNSYIHGKTDCFYDLLLFLSVYTYVYLLF